MSQLSRKIFIFASIWAFVFGVGGCTFKVALTSQRTALENQIMGTYSELEDGLVLNSSVRGPSTKTLKQRHDLAMKNQAFNQDDLDELKTKSLIGEAKNGMIEILKSGSGLAGNYAEDDMHLSKALVMEENQDRRHIWLQIIDSNSSLSISDLPKVQRTFATLMREKLKPGHWFQSEKGYWRQIKNQ